MTGGNTGERNINGLFRVTSPWVSLKEIFSRVKIKFVLFSRASSLFPFLSNKKHRIVDNRTKSRGIFYIRRMRLLPFVADRGWSSESITNSSFPILDGSTRATALCREIEGKDVFKISGTLYTCYYLLKRKRFYLRRVQRSRFCAYKLIRRYLYVEARRVDR